jgi:deoxyribose-phosphate aldolase
VLKVILESGALGPADTVGAAARLAIDCGADFVKTSTGKIPAGASLDAAGAMLEAIRTAGRPVGLKPSGGIRTFDEAMAYVELADSVMGEGWATPATFRFGASGLLDSLLAVVDGGPDSTSSSTY